MVLKRNIEQYKRYGQTHYLNNKEYYVDKALKRKEISVKFITEYKKSHPCVD